MTETVCDRERESVQESVRERECETETVCDRESIVCDRERVCDRESVK